MPQRCVTGLVGMVAVVAGLGCSRGKLSADASPPDRDASGISDIRVTVDGVGDGASSTDAPSRFCPPSPPGSGGGCGGPAPGQFCEYPDAPPSSCTTRCECRGITWICERACPTGTCPPNQPPEYSSCSSPTLTCAYPTPCGELRFTCNAFEIGSPANWFCSANCGCDGGATDAPASTDARDASADVSGDAPADVPGDAPAVDGGDLYCGDGVTCHGTDICVIIIGCGGPVNCQDTIDGGECPPGSTLNPRCPTGRPGCVPDCVPPPPTCRPKPATCTGGINCACLSGVCPTASCFTAEGRVATCANQ